MVAYIYHHPESGTIVVSQRASIAGKVRYDVAVKVRETGTTTSGYRESAPDCTGYKLVGKAAAGLFSAAIAEMAAKSLWKSEVAS